MFIHLFNPLSKPYGSTSFHVLAVRARCILIIVLKIMVVQVTDFISVPPFYYYIIYVQEYIFDIICGYVYSGNVQNVIILHVTSESHKINLTVCTEHLIG